MNDFFISYTSIDRTWAEWIAWQLEEAGYTTVLQAWDFRPGTTFVEAMNQAAATAERTIAVLSPDYLSSRFTRPEWEAAFAQDPTGEHGVLLPVRIREYSTKGLLPQVVYIDLVGLDEAAATETLLAGVRRERAKPKNVPAFPGVAQRVVSEQPRFPSVLPQQSLIERAKADRTDELALDELILQAIINLSKDYNAVTAQMVIEEMESIKFRYVRSAQIIPVMMQMRRLGIITWDSKEKGPMPSNVLEINPKYLPEQD
jgi:hypothetical protein